MGTPGPTPSIQLDDVLRVFENRSDPMEPLTANEVARELGTTRRTAHKKLDALGERGDLESKKPGARSRVWWLANDSHDDTGEGGLALKEEQFEEFADQVHEYAIFVLDSAGYIETWNEGASSIKGYSKAEIIGEHLSTFYTHEARERDIPQRNLRASAEMGEIEDEGWRLRKDGSRFWANITLTSLTDETGTVQGFIKVTRDMTDRHNRQVELRREKERFESLVTEVKDYAIFMLDPEGHVTSWNEGAANIKGYSEDEILGEHFSTFYTPEDREAGVPEHNRTTAAEDGRIEDEGWRLRQDGTRFWANVVITRLTDDDGNLRGFAKVTRDMTDRRQYEQQLKHQRDELDELNRLNAVIRDVDQALVTADTRDAVEAAVCDRLATSDIYTAAWIGELGPGRAFRTRTSAGIDAAVLDSSFDGIDSTPIELELANRALDTGETQIGAYDPDVGAYDHWTDSGFQPRPEAVVALPFTDDDRSFGALIVYASGPNEFDGRKLDVLTELAETITDSLTAIRRKEREKRLTALHRATRDLVHTESHEELGDVVTTTVVDTLGLRDAHIYHFQTEDNTLNPITSATADEDDVVQLPRLDAGSDSPIWAAFIDGTTRHLDADAGAELMIGGPDHRHELIVPLGDHGAIVVGGDSDESLDTDDRHLVELVAATAEAAFDRLESEANLRERDSILQDQNQRLQRLNQVNTVIREVDQGLVQAKTYEGIQRVVCDRLTSTDRFRFAWIGESADGDGSLRPAASAGPGQQYLDEISLDEASAEPAVVAARTGLVQVVENVADDLRAAPWRSAAFSREFQSCIAVPLTFGDVTYGVLAVYGDRPGTFGDIEESVFDELGTTIGNALHAVETKHAILSDHSVEIEFSITDPDETILTRLAGESNSIVSHEGTIPSADGALRLFLSADTADTDAITDAADTLPAVARASVVSLGEDRDLYEFELSEDSLVGELARRNVSVLEYEATPTEATLTVDVPASTDVGGFIDWFIDTHPSASFVSRQERERSVESTNSIRTGLADSLTERQFEVLKTAYLSGFFDAPRQSTGRDIADILDVSQPTVTEHLRAAQRRVLERVFEENP